MGQQCACTCEGDKADRIALAVSHGSTYEADEQLVKKEVAIQNVDDEPEVRVEEEEALPTKRVQPHILILEFDIVEGQPCHIVFGSSNSRNDSKLVVTEIKPESCFQKTVDGLPGLREGDIITSLDGLSGNTKQMLDSLVEAKKLGKRMKLVVNPRPATVVTDLYRKRQEELVIDCCVNAFGRLQIVGCAQSGALKEWNDEHIDSWVNEGDIITKVNGQEMDAGRLQSEMIRSWEDRGKVVLEFETQPIFEERLT